MKALSRISYNVCIDILIKRNDSYILQSPPCMALKLQGFDTILTFGGSHLWNKVYQAFECLELSAQLRRLELGLLSRYCDS